MRRLTKAVQVAILAIFSVPVAVVGTVLTSLIFLPLPVNLPREKAGVQSRISHVYDADGDEIAVFREFDQNIAVKPADLPISLKQAVIASEDKNFYNHSGVDIRGSLRALVADLRGGAVTQGGSTITQQYVKNVYIGSTNGVFERSIQRKVREAILANQVDRKFSKDEILFRYLNTIYLGEGAYGVGAASETYFRKPVSQLTLSESALLAAIIPAPSVFQPRGNPSGADGRRRNVLDKMLAQGYIDQAQHDEAFAQTVFPAVRGKPTGPVTLIQPPVKEFRKYPYFVDYVEKYLRARGYDPDRAGLKIQTSLDPDVQEAAEKSVADSLSGTTAPLEMALAAVEPPTGFVKAMVGGRDFYNGPSANVNLALGGCPTKPTDPKIRIVVPAECWSDPTAEISGGGPGRQTGSSFKAFTLAAALEQGFSPNKTYAAPRVYEIPGCTPRPGDSCKIGNAEGEGGGSQTIRTAIADSTNTVFAQIARDVGLEKVAAMAKKLGIGGAWFSPDRHGLSYTLGVLDTAPLDMASAYAVFANRGERNPTTPIVKVIDSTGKVLIDNTDRKPERAIDEIVADNETDLLRGVIDHGTGVAANIGRPAAGKTGTSQNYANAWFVGYTPTLSTAVWMGKTDGQGPAQSLVRIKGVARVYGGTIPARTWKAFMTKALAKVPITDFKEAAPITSITDRISRADRKGFDPGTRREAPDVTQGEQLEFNQPPPVAEEPTTTSTTEFTTPTTTFGGIHFP